MSGEIPARNSVRRRSSSAPSLKPGIRSVTISSQSPECVDAADAVEDGSDAAAEFVVVAVVETLEIDFVQIEPGAQVFENLRSGVAVRDETGDQSGGFGLFENGYRPFAGDQRLVVGADQNLCALGDGVAHQKFGRGFERRRYGGGIAQSLRRYPVLTIGAVQIAAQHSEAVGERSGMGVEEWFLFDWVALGSGGVSPGDVERAAAVVADFADSGLAFGDGAAMSASEAAHAIVVELLEERGIGFADLLVENGAEGGHGELCFYSNAAAVEARGTLFVVRNALRGSWWRRRAWGPSTPKCVRFREARSAQDDSRSLLRMTGY